MVNPGNGAASGRIVGEASTTWAKTCWKRAAAEMRDIRGSGICMVMQDPLTSLNPVFTVGDQLVENAAPRVQRTQAVAA